MKVLLECIGRFAIRGGPAYNPGEVIAFDADQSEELLNEHSDYWRRFVPREAASVVPTAVGKPARDKMLRSPEIKKGRA